MTTKKTAETVEPEEAELVDRLHEAKERAIELEHQIVKQFDERVKALGSVMKKHPLATIGIGVGVGYLLARLIHPD